MQFTNVIFNTYINLFSSDFPDLCLPIYLPKTLFLTLFDFSAIVTSPIFNLFLFKGRLNIE